MQNIHQKKNLRRLEKEWWQKMRHLFDLDFLTSVISVNLTYLTFLLDFLS